MTRRNEAATRMGGVSTERDVRWPVIRGPIERLSAGRIAGLYELLLGRNACLAWRRAASPRSRRSNLLAREASVDCFCRWH